MSTVRRAMYWLAWKKVGTGPTYISTRSDEDVIFRRPPNGSLAYTWYRRRWGR